MSATTRIKPCSCRASTAASEPQLHLRRQHRPAGLGKFRSPKTAYDGNGNVRALVKADAANPEVSGVNARYAYDGFGKEVAVSGADADKNTFRFSTKQLDGEFGMNYYGHRYYMADTGRWINRDPLNESDDLNLYAFVSNSSIREYDVNGLFGLDDITSYLQRTAQGCVNFDWIGTPIIAPGVPPGIRPKISGSLCVSLMKCNCKNLAVTTFSLNVGAYWGVSADYGPKEKGKRIPHPCIPGKMIRPGQYAYELKKCQKKGKPGLPPKSGPGGQGGVTLQDCPSHRGFEWDDPQVCIKVHASGGGFGAEGEACASFPALQFDGGSISGGYVGGGTSVYGELYGTISGTYVYEY